LVEVYLSQNINSVPVGSKMDLYVSVKIRGSTEDRRYTPATLSHYVLLDCSGSMAEDGKLETAKEALRQYIKALGDEDDITVILFGVPTPKRTGILQGKSHVLESINSLMPFGDTPLYGAVKEFVSAVRESGKRVCLLVLTDGIATDINEPEPYLEILRTVSELISRSYVMGIGREYDERILIAIRNATNGEFEHIRTPSDVIGKFKEASTKGKRIVAQSPRMLIKTSAGVRLAGIYRADPQIQELTSDVKMKENGEMEVFMPDLVADEDQVYVMMFELPSKQEGEYREARIRFQGIDHPPLDLIVTRTSQPGAGAESDPAPRLLYTQIRERWIAQKAITGDQAAIEETEKILAAYQSNPEKMKTMPLSHIQDLQKAASIISAGSSVDSETKKQVTAKLTKRLRSDQGG